MSNEGWLTEFKIALVDDDREKMIELNENLPTFEKIEQMKEAQAYIAEAIRRLHSSREEVRSNMKKLQKTKSFLKSSDRIRIAYS